MQHHIITNSFDLGVSALGGSRLTANDVHVLTSINVDEPKPKHLMEDMELLELAEMSISMSMSMSTPSNDVLDCSALKYS
jgi:hypothetical protein